MQHPSHGLTDEQVKTMKNNLDKLQGAFKDKLWDIVFRPIFEAYQWEMPDPGKKDETLGSQLEKVLEQHDGDFYFKEDREIFVQALRTYQSNAPHCQVIDSVNFQSLKDIVKRRHKTQPTVLSHPKDNAPHSSQEKKPRTL